MKIIFIILFAILVILPSILHYTIIKNAQGEREEEYVLLLMEKCQIQDALFEKMSVYRRLDNKVQCFREEVSRLKLKHEVPDLYTDEYWLWENKCDGNFFKVIRLGNSIILPY